MGVYVSALVLYTVDFRRRVQGLLLAAGSAIGVVIPAGAGLLIPSIAANQATTEIYTRTYTLSLHDALPISRRCFWVCT